MIAANTQLNLTVLSRLCKQCGTYPLSVTVDTIIDSKATLNFLGNGGIEYGDISSKEWCSFVMVNSYGDLLMLLRFLGIKKPENWP